MVRDDVVVCVRYQSQRFTRMYQDYKDHRHAVENSSSIEVFKIVKVLRNVKQSPSGITGWPAADKHVALHVCVRACEACMNGA